ncbi:PREDICTED: uncharacterized protein LOC104592831 isoform X2 [Nelumbo nucifera]|uniref:Uncharacterized protein LOC104592831 isoform X2 n=1 Tax=Nelumbo nucifera TaxID=4432 RepID=A0A1U7ZAU7_NELNU|nr:PREDICTED: uncharacterized protein LOC104592831 isoform X2 [Nelumbo nucifera]XP_019052499.1 PREDICTED: uncharacterized protein LOC104592831 isoform X2 [Nelumbo nucifera]
MKPNKENSRLLATSLLLIQYPMSNVKQLSIQALHPRPALDPVKVIDYSSSTASIIGSVQVMVIVLGHDELQKAEYNPQLQWVRERVRRRNSSSVDCWSSASQFTSFPLPMTIVGWPGGLTSLDTCHHFKLLCPWMGVLDLLRLARYHICFFLKTGQRGAQLITTLLGASTVISSLQG